MSHSNQPPNDEFQTVRVRGRTRAFLERRTIDRRDYYLLERVGSPLRERYLAFDPRHGPGGDFFLLQTWPAGPLAQQQLRVLRRLKDDSFPRVVEWQQRYGQVDVVLTWVEGISLAEYLNNIRAGRRPPLAPWQAVRLIHGLANAVCKLHHPRQIAHGDIQPSNVIVTNHPSRLVLIDFGSAWTTDTGAFREQGDGVNRCYSAPELHGDSIPDGFLADQFSVSMLLYELLTQQVPYAGLGGKAGWPEYIDGAGDSLIAPSQASEIWGGLPRSLRDWIDRVTLRGLALDARQRYPDRHAWLNDLFEVSARFRLAPELSPAERLLTRVIGWFVTPRQAS